MPTSRRYRSLLVGLVAPLAAASWLAAPATSAAATPLTPQRLLDAINYDYHELFQADDLTFDLQTLTVSAHGFLRSGRCHPGNPQPDTQLQEYSLRGLYMKFCTKVNGRYQTVRIPRRELTYPPTAATMDFTPVLDPAGEDAAESVDLTTSQYGTPLRVEIHRNTGTHQSEAEITYQRGPGDGQQLRELRLRVVDGHETVGMAWYA